MSLFVIAIYFSLMFSLISIIRLIPFSRGIRNTLFIRFLICAANLYSVLFLTGSVGILPIIIIAVTFIYTEGYEYLKKYISVNFIRLIRSNSFLLKLNLFLTFNANAFGFLVMAKASEAFKQSEEIKGEELLSAYSGKIHNDLAWLSNCMIFLMQINRNQTAYSLLQSTSIDLTKNNILYQYLQIAIQLYCDNNEFELAELFLDYMETHYYDAQHKYTNIRSFLYYSAKGGNEQLFDKIIKDFPEVQKFPDLPEMRDFIKISEKPDTVGKEPKSYVFNLSSGKTAALYPLYIFSGIICLITIFQLILSEGGTLTERLFSGFILPIEYIRCGAAVKILIRNGEWIRLITPIFLHAGLLHLGLNIFGLINIGRLLLRFFDKYVLLFIFIGGAAAGNLLSLFFSSAFLSVGASGGVFSILGALFIYLLWHRREIHRVAFHKIIVNFAVILAIQILFGFQNSNIDNFAHLGGFLGGVLLTVITLLTAGSHFQKYFVYTLKTILFLACICLLIFWPRIFSGNQFEKIPLTETVSKPDFEYSIPETWEEESDRYIDLLSGAQIIFNSYSGFYNLEDQIEAIKEVYTKDSNFLFHREAALEKGWISLDFLSNENPVLYNLYYFCRKSGNTFVEAYVFLDPDLYDEYLPFFQKVLDSVR